MSLTAGTRLGPYEILSAIGAGGMGEVYRARDARLAALKHLNIGAVYGSMNSRLKPASTTPRATAPLPPWGPALAGPSAHPFS